MKTKYLGQKTIGRYSVHVYFIAKAAKEYQFDDEKLAKDLAVLMFDRIDVYKVKVWDTEKGHATPNRPIPGQLLVELI